MFTEDDLLPISALQHLIFCERQCGLIHIEQAWVENRLTVEGRFLHDRVDEYEVEVRGELRAVRSLRIRSLELGLIGKADLIEFHQLVGEDKNGVVLKDTPGLWRPLPVEYKRGQPKPDICDEVQLCAQAMCLEEMLGTQVPEGQIFYGKPRRRHDVKFSADLRMATKQAAARLHELIRSGKTPPAVYEKKCESCSLKQICLPKAADGKHSARKYLSESMADVGVDGK